MPLCADAALVDQVELSTFNQPSLWLLLQFGGRMKKLMLILSLLLLASPAWAATVTLNLSWSVTNTPTVPATTYRVEENVSGTWGTVTTVPATQLTHSIPGRALGMYSFRVIPVANGLDAAPSNTTICGAVPPDTTVSMTCSATVVP